MQTAACRTGNALGKGPTAKAAQVRAFVIQVVAQSGKALTTEQAAILTRLAMAL